MAKYKSKKFIPQWDSYKDLGRDNWEALNRGETVDLDEVPKIAKEYLEKANKSNSKKESE
tara:strand:+ start:310 stop:489 length:180 start_codon:yes stop_codon:yes gene_type:complete